MGFEGRIETWHLAPDERRDLYEELRRQERNWSVDDYVRCFEADRNRYYQTKHWRKTSKLQRAYVPLCERCGAARPARLEAHHKHYKTIGREQPRIDLLTLCRECHEFTDGRLIAYDERPWDHPDPPRLDVG